MNKQSTNTSSHTNYGLQLLLLFIFMICMALIVSFTVLISPVLTFDNTANTLVSLIINTLCVFVVPIFIWKLLFYKQRKLQEVVNFSLSINIKLLLTSIALIVVSIPLMEFLGFINYELITTFPSSILYQIDTISLKNQELLFDVFKIDLPIVIKSIVLVITIAVLPAVGEEFFFRSGVQYLLSKKIKSGFLSILITSLIFAFIHFEFYGFFIRLFMGFILGYIFFQTGNILYAIIIHFLFNATQVIIILSIYDTLALEGITNINTSSFDIYSIPSVVMLVTSLISLYFIHTKKLLHATKRPFNFHL